MATVLSVQDRLTSIANVLDQGAADHDLFAFVTDGGDTFELGVRPLHPHLHPCAELHGVVAPPAWWAVGIVIAGQARFLDQPDRGAEPITTTYLVERGGHEVSLLRRADAVTEAVGRVDGRIPDLLRSMLGVPEDGGAGGHS